jgi:excisionase family DNA binding protein
MESLNGDYITTVEASALIGKCESMIARLCQNGRLIGARKIGKTWLIPREAIESYTQKKRGPRTKKERLSSELEGIRAEIADSKEV